MPATRAIHLSPSGSDRGDGSAARPFATPARAQAAARRRGPGQVVVHGGRFELEAPLVFTPADNGQRWSAAPGAAPVFSGGRRLSGWTVGTHQGRTTWTLDLPEVRSGAWYFSQLWVDGRRRQRPRLPRTGFFRFDGVDGHPDTGFRWHQGPSRAEYPEGSIRRFRNLDDVQVVAYQLWFDIHLRIRDLDEQRRIASFHAPSLGSLRDEGGQFARFALINVGEALAEPGEWYLDRAAGTLTYLPLPHEDPAVTEVIAPRLAELVRFQGSATRPVAGVVLEHLGLMHNEWSRAVDKCGTVQAAIDVPGAVVLDRAERCALYGCEIAHCAGYGVEMLAGCHDNAVAACVIRDLGAGAVKIGHEELRVHESAVGAEFTPDRRWLRPMAATIADCHLHDGGHVYPSAIGVWIGNSGANRVQHNHIHHFAYTGISVGWTWGYRPTRTWDNRIERNHIHHINHQRLLSDNGGIYTLGVQPGSTVVDNHLHDIACYHYGGWGLYPDEGSSGMLWAGNCVHHVQYCGFSVHYGRFLTVRDNIFAAMDRAMLNPGRTDLSCGLIFERNLTWFDQDNLKPDADWSPQLCATRRNLVWNDAPGGVRWHLGSLAAEQAAGRWQDSVEADPLFADPRSGDFTLRADSPALALGFRGGAWRRAGVRPAAVRAKTWSAYRLPPAPPRAVAVAWLEPGELAVEDGVAVQPLRVVLSNPSGKRVHGRWRVRLGDGTVPRCSPGPVLTADLGPGASVVCDVVVQLPATQGRQWLQVRGDERTCFSAAVPVIVPTVVAMPRLPAGSALDEGLDLSITHAGHRMLEGRAAVIGDELVIEAVIHDPDPQTDRTNPWRGAALEVFAGPEPAPGSSGHPAKVFFIPPDRTGPAEARPDDLVRPGWEAAATADGWRLRAALPLTALKIDRDAAGFRFDITLSARSPVPGQNHMRFPRWGSTGNFTNILNLAKVRLG